MKHKKRYQFVFFVFIAYCLVTPVAESLDGQFDPLSQITNAFPRSVHLNEKQRLLEFCPDNTCDGFVASSRVPLPVLKDFAYLYIYFFSNYYILQQWRKRAESLSVADRVLSKPAYARCKSKDSREKARCVLIDLSRNGKIRLLAVRYDENRRIVVRQNIVAVLSKSEPPQK